MNRKRLTKLLNLILCIIPLNFVLVNSAAAGGPQYVSYCENKAVKNLTLRTCKSGFKFGNPLPSCVCVKGIYRMFTDVCEQSDGFTENEICFIPVDTDTNANAVGMHMAEMKAPYDWKSPAILYERAPDGILTLATEADGLKFKNNNFYVLNAEVLVSGKKICAVAKTAPKQSSICRYYESSNGVLTSFADATLSIDSSCSANGKKMKSSVCFGTLDPATSSECTLNCGSDAKTPTAKPGKGKNTSLTKADFDKNCTNPDDYRNHDNRFLNRKMLLYNVVNQLDMGSSNQTILENLEPNNTLGLFEIMKSITKKVCPSQYVVSEWIDQAVDLFYILHKGNVFRYEEVLSADQYNWISTILEECNGKAVPIPLEALSNPNNTCSGSASGLATGYCRPALVNGEPSSKCDHINVKVDTTSDDSFKQKHYIPEVAWNIVDLVHVACFPQFNASYRMFHVLEQAVEKLFTLQIKNLWHHPGWLEPTKTKLLGYGADNNVFNLDVCLQAAYGMRNGDLPRLVRPFAPVYLRKKRAAPGFQRGRRRSASGRAAASGAQQLSCSATLTEFIPTKCYT